MRSHWVTCLLEVETIVNSRPMVVETINNVTSEVAIALCLNNEIQGCYASTWCVL